MTDTTNPPELALTPIALRDGEPATDRGYVTDSGLRLRVRVKPVARSDGRAPTNGDVALAPDAITLAVSLAQIDDDGAVMTAPAGGLMIMTAHDVTISRDALTNPAFDPAAAIDTALRQQAAVFANWVDRQQALGDVLAAWGAN